MASNFRINSLNYDDSPSVYREKLGSYGSIEVRKSRWKSQTYTEMTMWTAEYTIRRQSWEVIVSSFIDNDAKVRRAAFEFRLCLSLNSSIDFGVSDQYFLGSSRHEPIEIGPRFKICRQKNKTITTSGYVIETRTYLYNTIESKGAGLFVVEEMRKSGGDKKPCKVTVGHYFTFSCGNMFSENKIDIGLSVILTIQPSTEVGLDVTLEGPTKHPSAALHYMFHEVMENGIWKPTICPHCARIERLHIDMLRLVNSGHNGSFEPLNGRIPDKLILVKNNGNYFNGDNNASVVIKGGVAYILIIPENFLQISQSIIKICNMLGIQDIEMKRE